MKQLLLLFVVLFQLNVFAQNDEYSIYVKDIETLQPIENATVTVLKTKQVLMTNADGKITFVLSGGSNIQVSEMNYENLTVRWAALKESGFVVYLKNKKENLDEVVVSKENPQKMLQKVVSNSKQKISVAHRLKVYVREFFMLDNQYSYYNDGLVNFQFNKNNTTTLLVEQNRSYGLIDTDVSADLKGYDLNDIMENYSNFKYLDPLLDAKAKKEYDFTTKGHSKNKDYYIMSVVPLDKAKEAIDNFEIIYDPEKKIIIEFTISVTPATLDKVEEKTKEGEKNITKSFVKVNYRWDGTDYYLLSSNEEIGYNVVLKDKTKNVQVRNSFVTTGFNKQNFTYNESDVFKEKSLFNKKNKILTNYWDISGFTATEQEKAIIASLEFKL
ncbi:carboxypeptidase-like regulatory domain-containing protein [Flavobacterium tyrosinilyticum]|uniref:carboxypeptidase-like regulatory domain-containing protein n=1 Tax=Flavobacterium tyrosinilyticum TaxID=1658740 RepID=UPI002030EDA1|nr:carboxypeptidase-like regulatory domain-containing protein [Flavobacterium tyrosinilyticum]MCM0666420.1 carboxypeptidase-like regulatory domain-containing protein [Flavobacterium tyrosinilyticum]